MNYQYGGKDLVLLQYLEERLRKDPGSSFFAMLSYFYLEIGKVAEALSVAQRGVIAHPNYSTGHAVLAMAMMRAGFYRDARKEILKADELHPGSKMIDSLKTEVDRQEQADSIGRRLAEQYRKTAGTDIMKTVEETLKANPITSSNEDLLIPGLESIVGEDFSKSPPKYVIDAEPAAPAREAEHSEEAEGPAEEPVKAREIIDRVAREFGEKIDTNIKEPEQHVDMPAAEPREPEEFDLDALARELDSAGPIKPVGAPAGREDDSGIELTPEIVTDTLAMIFEQQGQLNTAIQAYNILLKKKPEKGDFYREKIAELTARADGKA
jgi:tetratricopeptide (TPR) repeat protein